MSYQAVLLLLLAAAIHAAWNFLGKRQKATPSVFLLANTLGTLTLLIPIAGYATARNIFLSGFLSLSLWGWLLLTGLFQAFYYLGLSGAYRNGDLSLAYPLLRAAPVVMVVLTNWFLNRGGQISSQGSLGMMLVAFGAFLLPITSFKNWDWKRFLAPVMGWALFAAVNTVGYSLVDDHALRMLRQTASSTLGVTLVYAFWEGISASFWLCLFLLPSRMGRKNLGEALRNEIKQAGLTGLGIYLAYTLVLISMAYVENVSYVVAFRQTSILFGAVLGIFLLKEPPYRPRLLGIGILFIGLVMVGLG